MKTLLLTPLLLVSFAAAADKTTRVYITSESSWHVASASGDQQISGAGNATTAEVIKLFRQKCSAVIVTTRADKADYIVLATDDGSGALRKGRTVVVSNQSGDILLSKSDRSFGGAVNDACKVITSGEQRAAK